jgi:hypothetical protein
MFRRYAYGKPRYPAPDLPHYLVAVDLGKRKAGVAIFWCDYANDMVLLVNAATVHGQPMAGAIFDYVEVDEDAPVYWVCEWPMKYGDRRKYHKDIDALLQVGDALDRLIEGWEEKYRPGEWKGNAPKSAHHRRIREALRAEEMAIAPHTNDHDAWDAIGIGLFATNRTKRGGAT